MTALDPELAHSNVPDITPAVFVSRGLFDALTLPYLATREQRGGFVYATVNGTTYTTYAPESAA